MCEDAKVEVEAHVRYSAKKKTIKIFSTPIDKLD